MLSLSERARPFIFQAKVCFESKIFLKDCSHTAEVVPGIEARKPHFLNFFETRAQILKFLGNEIKRLLKMHTKFQNFLILSIFFRQTFKSHSTF